MGVKATTRQAVGLQQQTAVEPRALPWAGMKQACGLNAVAEDAFASSPRVRLIIRLLQPVCADVGIDLGGSQVGVAEEFLNAAQIRAGV